MPPEGIGPSSQVYLPAEHCPWEESNLHVQLRRLAFYPLNYRGGFGRRGKLVLYPLSYGGSIQNFLRNFVEPDEIPKGNFV